MSITVNRQDPRYETLRKGHNARWPVTASEGASRIEICRDANEVHDALQRTVSAGLRPTVRCGGHCYEDFVSNNPGGVILDLSMLTDATPVPGAPKYRISAGTQLGVAYANLYKTAGVTLPGGSCYSVAAGGHITGGGYGVLSRLHGLTVDWLTAVDILTVDAKGKVTLRRVDRDHDPDLFRACRGAGGNNFGVVTDFYFEKLPLAPQEIMSANISFPWKDMTLEKFTHILTTYGDYMEHRGKDPDTWGLFTFLGLSHRDSGGVSISAQFCNPDGTCKDLRVLNEFLDLFQACDPVQGTSSVSGMESGSKVSSTTDIHKMFCSGPHQLTRHLWYDATVSGGVAGSGRGKYKSSYMKRSFTRAEAACIYKHFTTSLPNQNLRGHILSVDSYGGAVNRAEMVDETSIPQRASIMKLQWMTFWSSEEDDAARVQWVDNFYKDLYSGPDADPAHKETPYPNESYEGCYINYPDNDMLRYPFWTELYYGNKGLYPFLQEVKRKYDPNNIFHHAMSIRA